MSKYLRYTLWTIAILFILSLIFHQQPKKAESSSKPIGKAYYSSTTTFSTSSDSDLTIYATVTNKGTASGTPRCKIYARDDAYSVSGVDSITKPSALGAGQTWNTKFDLAITNNGANKITQVTLNCQ